MKRLISILLIIIALFCSCVNKDANEPESGFDYLPDGELPGVLDKVDFGSQKADDGKDKKNNDKHEILKHDIIKGVWVSYGDLHFEDMNEKQCKSHIDEMMEKISSFGFNTVFFHVRPFGDSLYMSDYFPASHLLSGAQGGKMKYDPLKIAIEAAHKYNLSLHAWINPMRIQLKTGETAIPYSLSDDNPALMWLNDGDIANDKNIMQDESGIYYNIAEEQVLQLILNGIEEIAKNYNVDGIHFDDYFYPSTDEELDRESYESYLVNGGDSSLIEFRTNNVNRLIESSYNTVKKINDKLIFSVSPSANITNDLEVLAADCECWARNCYVDMMIPQIYFGFENETMPFEATLDKWKRLINGTGVELVIGIAGYKTGQKDSYALSGRAEWTEHDDILSRQVEIIFNDESLSGVCVFDYDAMFENTQSNVRKNERNLLKKKLCGKN